jgi:hypothetical protein
MKFHRRKESSLLGHTVVIYELGKFQMEASQFGVSLHGESPLLENMADLQEFARVMSDAWKDHLSLKPEILRP